MSNLLVTAFAEFFRPWHGFAIGGHARRIVQGLMIVVTIIGAVVGAARMILPYPYGDRIATDSDQQILYLSDGTRVRVGPASELTVRYTRKGRVISLRRGEVSFDVAKDPSRPFVVMTGLSEIRAVGTRFDVDYIPTRGAVIRVEEGVVEVITRPATRQGQAKVRTLAAGQSFQIAGGRVSVNETTNINNSVRWSRGQLIFDKTPLGVAVVEFNRLNSTQLVIDDPMIAAIPLSGLFQQTDSAAFAQAVADVYDLEVIQLDDELHLRSRKHRE